VSRRELFVNRRHRKYRK